MKHTIAILMIALTSIAASADTTTKDVDRFVGKVVKEIPLLQSIGIAVVRDGKPFYAQSYGNARQTPPAAATANTGYYIASATKAFTGLACAILAQRGVIDLDAPITKYLPEVQMASPLDASKLTLRKFLTHTSEISNEAIVFRTAFSGEHTPSQLVQLLNSSKPGKPGFQYDNLGYVVASLVLERVTGKPWQQVLSELVFKPLGMNHTTAFMSEAQKAALATPYEMMRSGNLEELKFVKNDQMMHAAGGIVTTPNDLLRWLEANIRHGKIGSQQVLPAAAFREVQKPYVATDEERDTFVSHGYGFGWYTGSYGTDRLLFHGGGFEGWRTMVSFMPDRKNGVAVMSNAGGPSLNALMLIENYIYDRLAGKPDVESIYETRLGLLKSRVTSIRARYVAGVAERAKRASMLKHANSAYTGTYVNPLYGTIHIEERDGKLYASLANLSSLLEPFTEPEAARVEMTPGTGEVLRFAFSTGDKADSLKWRDEVFRRVE